MNIWDWQEKATITTSFPNGAQLRLTICAASGYELGVYQALMREARAHVRDTYGVEASQFVNDEIAEHLAEWGQFHQRAIMLSALLTVETKENDESEWTKDELPEDWRSIATFARAIPGTLYDEWLSLALDLNPGQFITLPGDDQKKAVSVNVARLLN